MTTTALLHHFKFPVMFLSVHFRNNKMEWWMILLLSVSVSLTFLALRRKVHVPYSTTSPFQRYPPSTKIAPGPSAPLAVYSLLAHKDHLLEFCLQHAFKVRDTNFS